MVSKPIIFAVLCAGVVVLLGVGTVTAPAGTAVSGPVGDRTLADAGHSGSDVSLVRAQAGNGVWLSSTGTATLQSGEERTVDPPSASVSVTPENPDVNEVAAFDATETTPGDGDIESYEWEVDGTTVAEGERVRHRFEREGRHEIRLRVTDSNAAQSSVTRYVHVGDMGIDTDPDPGTVVEPERRTVFETEPEVDLTIPFRTGDVRLNEGVESVVLESDREQQWVIVQFGDQPSPREMRVLDQSGYERVVKLTDRTYYAGIPRENVERVGNLDSVRSIAQIQPRWKLSPELAEQFRNAPRGTSLRVSVQSFERLDRTAEEFDLESDEGNLYTGELTAQETRSLQQRPQIRWIEQAPITEPEVREGKRLTGTHLEPFAFAEQADGVRVGVIDSGIQHDHVYFDNVEIVDSYDRRDNDWDPAADNFTWGGNSHGTHVASVIAGQGFDGPSSNVDSRFHVGVARNATLVVARGFSHKNFDAVLNNGSQLITNSYGWDTEGEYLAAHPEQIDNWAYENPEILLIASFGNYDSSEPSEQWGTSPGLEKNVLAVGSIDDGSGSITNGYIAHRAEVDAVNTVSSLNNLTQPADGRQKPDINAPARRITGANPHPTDDNVYGTSGGSSLAAPHVAGIAALYKSTYENAWADDMKAALIAGTGPVENPAPDRRPEGYGAAHAYTSIYNTEYEHDHRTMAGSFEAGFLSDADQATTTFEVPADSERVVAALSWTDPAGDSSTTDNQVNNLNLYLGPTDDPQRYSSASTTDTVEKITVEDLEASEVGTDWRLTVDPVEMDESPQPYGSVVRVVAEEPELSVTAPDEIVVEPAPAAETSFEFEVDGEGAPVHGTHAQVYSDSNLNYCGGQRGFIIGTLNEGQSHFASDDLCFEVPDEPGTYDVDIFVNSTNAQRQSIHETVEVRVPGPRVELEPYELNVSVGEQKDYSMYVSNVSGGVDAVAANVSLEDPEIGVLTALSLTPLAEDEDWTVEIGPDRNWLRFEAEGSAIQETNEYGTVTIGPLTAGGSTPGKTPVNINVIEIETLDGDSYQLRSDQDGAAPQRGLLNVTRGPVDPVLDPPRTPTFPGVIEVGLDITLDIGPMVDSIDDPTGVRWRMGDGTTYEGEQTVQHAYRQPGEYEVVVTVENETATYRYTETITVESGNIHLGSVDLSKTTVQPGEEVRAGGILTNPGTETETTVVALRIDGEVVDEKRVDVAPGEKGTVTFEFTPEEPGEYAVSIGDAEPRTVTVEAGTGDNETDVFDTESEDGGGDQSVDTESGEIDDQTDSGTAEDSTADNETANANRTETETSDDANPQDEVGPGFGISAAIVALGGLLFLVRGRQSV